MHCTPGGRSYVLNIVVHQNVRLSEATVTEVLDSDHLPVMFSIVDHVRAMDVLDPAVKIYRLGAVSESSLWNNISWNPNSFFEETD
jgi:hypothetical protein